VEPFAEILKKTKVLEKEKREVQKQINVIFNKEINPCKKEVEEIEARIDKLYKEKREKSKEGEPEIKGKKQEFSDKIEALEKEKDKVKDDWDDKWDKYYD